MKELFGILFGIAVIVVVAGLLVALQGVCLSIVWAWFVVPQFGLAPLSIPMACGLKIVSGMIVSIARQPKEGENALVNMVGGSLMGLLFGYLITLFL